MRLNFHFFARIALLLLLSGLGDVSSMASETSTPALSDADGAAKRSATQKTFKEGVTPFLKTYCSECHGDKKQKGGLTFRSLLKDPGLSAFTRQWRTSSASVKAHEMPPDDAKMQPTDEERRMFVDWVSDLKFLSEKDPGPFVIRRLTKVEYGNTLRDLLGVDSGVVAELPDEVPGAGYLNSLSPLLMEQYLSVANEVLNRLFPSEGHVAAGNEQRLFGAAPAPGADRRAAAREAALRLARRAYRRPATGAEVEVLAGVFDLAAGAGRSYSEAMRLVLKAVLVSPQFLFITPADGAEPGVKEAALDDHQLASRISYLLWATMPDPELSALADAGRLRDRGVLLAQVRRLLADGRSRALFDGFGAQWLGLGKLGTKTFDAKKFPQMTPEMRSAMYDEARLLFESVVRENLGVMTLIDCDYTFLNQTVASVYGMEPSVPGSEMRRVRLTDPNRGGILGMPGVLAATSFPNRTSPVNRGVWVLEQVLGQHVPPAPPNVPALEKQGRDKVANLTIRQRTELHRTNAVCANCHKILDPIGFGLENFDAVGRWRDVDDSGGAIDATGELPGKKRFGSPAELKRIIAERRDDVCRNLTEKLMAYALCRQLEGYDEVVVDRITEAVIADGYRMQTLIAEVIASYPFMNRRVAQ
jgi:mono/diheme cytochrome c family protein